MGHDLCVRAREFLGASRDIMKKRSYVTLLSSFSPALRAELQTSLSSSLLHNVTFFQGCDVAAVRSEPTRVS